MNKLPEVGDLAYLAKWPCCGKGEIGSFFVVSSIESQQGETSLHCTYCDIYFPVEPTTDIRPKYSVALSWCKRVPPLDELEGQKTQEDLRIPTKEKTNA